MMYKKILKILILIILILLGSYLAVQVLIHKNEKEDIVEDADYIVVLGARLYGTRLSPTLKDRMDKALEVIKENKDIKIVVSGGMGAGEDIPESQAMKMYLIENGIEKDRIIEENKSTSTMENLKYTKNIIDEYNDEKKHKIIIVTNEFHMFRSKLLARRIGFIPYAKPSKTTIPYLKDRYYFREYFAVIKSLLLDW